MLSYANKFLFALAGFAFVAFFGYSAAVGERSGAFLLFGLCVGALTVGLVVTGATLSDGVSAPVEEGAPIEYRSVDPASVARPSSWPLVAALALGLVAVGAAVDAKLMVAGLVVGLVPAAGWLGQVWREHAAWTTRLSERLDERVLVPIALPVGMILLVGAIAIAVSRVLLALPEKGIDGGRPGHRRDRAVRLGAHRRPPAAAALVGADRGGGASRRSRRRRRRRGRGHRRAQVRAQGRGRRTDRRRHRATTRRTTRR